MRGVRRRAPISSAARATEPLPRNAASHMPAAIAPWIPSISPDDIVDVSPSLLSVTMGEELASAQSHWNGR